MPSASAEQVDGSPQQQIFGKLDQGDNHRRLKVADKIMSEAEGINRIVRFSVLTLAWMCGLSLAWWGTHLLFS